MARIEGATRPSRAESSRAEARASKALDIRIEREQERQATGSNIYSRIAEVQQAVPRANAPTASLTISPSGSIETKTTTPTTFKEAGSKVPEQQEQLKSLQMAQRRTDAVPTSSFRNREGFGSNIPTKLEQAKTKFESKTGYRPTANKASAKIPKTTTIYFEEKPLAQKDVMTSPTTLNVIEGTIKPSDALTTDILGSVNSYITTAFNLGSAPIDATPIYDTTGKLIGYNVFSRMGEKQIVDALDVQVKELSKNYAGAVVVKTGEGQYKITDISGFIYDPKTDKINITTSTGEIVNTSDLSSTTKDSIQKELVKFRGDINKAIKESKETTTSVETSLSTEKGSTLPKAKSPMDILTGKYEMKKEVFGTSDPRILSQIKTTKEGSYLVPANFDIVSKGGVTTKAGSFERFEIKNTSDILKDKGFSSTSQYLVTEGKTPKSLLYEATPFEKLYSKEAKDMKEELSKGVPERIGEVAVKSLSGFGLVSKETKVPTIVGTLNIFGEELAKTGEKLEKEFPFPLGTQYKFATATIGGLLSSPEFVVKTGSNILAFETAGAKAIGSYIAGDKSYQKDFIPFTTKQIQKPEVLMDTATLGLMVLAPQLKGVQGVAGNLFKGALYGTIGASYLVNPYETTKVVAPFLIADLARTPEAKTSIKTVQEFNIELKVKGTEIGKGVGEKIDLIDYERGKAYFETPSYETLGEKSIKPIESSKSSYSINKPIEIGSNIEGKTSFELKQPFESQIKPFEIKGYSSPVDIISKTEQKVRFDYTPKNLEVIKDISQTTKPIGDLSTKKAYNIYGRGVTPKYDLGKVGLETSTSEVLGTTKVFKGLESGKPSYTIGESPALETFTPAQIAEAKGGISFDILKGSEVVGKGTIKLQTEQVALEGIGKDFVKSDLITKELGASQPSELIGYGSKGKAKIEYNIGSKTFSEIIELPKELKIGKTYENTIAESLFKGSPEFKTKFELVDTNILDTNKIFINEPIERFGSEIGKGVGEKIELIDYSKGKGTYKTSSYDILESKDIYKNNKLIDYSGKTDILYKNIEGSSIHNLKIKEFSDSIYYRTTEPISYDTQYLTKGTKIFKETPELTRIVGKDSVSDLFFEGKGEYLVGETPIKSSQYEIFTKRKAGESLQTGITKEEFGTLFKPEPKEVLDLTGIKEFEISGIPEFKGSIITQPKDITSKFEMPKIESTGEFKSSESGLGTQQIQTTKTQTKALTTDFAKAIEQTENIVIGRVKSFEQPTFQTSFKTPSFQTSTYQPQQTKQDYEVKQLNDLKLGESFSTKSLQVETTKPILSELTKPYSVQQIKPLTQQATKTSQIQTTKPLERTLDVARPFQSTKERVLTIESTKQTQAELFKPTSPNKIQFVRTEPSPEYPPPEIPRFNFGRVISLDSNYTGAGGLSIPRLSKESQGRRTLYPDLFSVARTQMKYGKATFASLEKRPELWSLEGGRVPTLEELEEKQQPKKQKKNKFEFKKFNSFGKNSFINFGKAKRLI